MVFKSSQSPPDAATVPGEPAGVVLADDPEEGEYAKVLLDSDDSGADLPDNEDALLDIYYQGLRAKSRLKAGPKRTRDKSKSTCTVCQKLGHWAGDPECELVKSGQKPRSASLAQG